MAGYQGDKRLTERFGLHGRIAVITGGAGLLGEMHAEAVAEAGGIPVLTDVRGPRARDLAKRISETYGVEALGLEVDITRQTSLQMMLEEVVGRFGRVDILVNNAANDPKVRANDDTSLTRFEHFPEEQWAEDLSVGLTGAFLASQVIGQQMVKQGGGVMINIASDLALIAPDQRLYRREGLSKEHQPAKPVTYSVVKHGLVGLTRYLATYWAEAKIRVNALAPGGVFNDQSPDFVRRVESLIPMGRMARKDEYKGAIVFLSSEASSYMTGSVLVLDGGRTCW